MECDFTHKCRTCLSENNIMFPLYDNYENNLSLADILQCLLKVQLDIFDNVPKEICQDCATLLIQFYNFSVIFEESNKKLQSYLETKKEHLKFIPEENSQKQEEFVEEEEVLDHKIDICEEINDKLEPAIISIKYEPNNDFYEEVGSQTSDCDNYEEITICTTNELYGSDVEKHKCDICDKTFKTLLLLKKHLQLHIQNRKFICEVCGYASLKKSYLVDHMAMHAKDKPYTCCFCGKTFRQRSAFCRHRKIHTNPMQIVCEMCGQKFTDRGTLKTHILLLHIKSRKFKCIICNQTFPLKGTLDKHLRRHQQKEGATKNFSCTECSMEYFDKSSLKRHYITKHGDVNRTFKCQYCCKEYTAKSNLYKHINTHHKDHTSDS